MATRWLMVAHHTTYRHIRDEIVAINGDESEFIVCLEWKRPRIFCLACGAAVDFDNVHTCCPPGNFIFAIIAHRRTCEL